jgi:hypothetical protein
MVFGLHSQFYTTGSVIFGNPFSMRKPMFTLVPVGFSLWILNLLRIRRVYFILGLGLWDMQAFA